VTVSGVLVDPGDERWASALAGAPLTHTGTPEYVKLTRIGSVPSPSVPSSTSRIAFFRVPLLPRGGIDGNAMCGERVRDAVSPYAYPGIVMSNAARESPGLADACLPDPRKIRG
jgi:hypothetical protein